MILYFSGTGNTFAVAKAIAEKTGDELFDMGKAYREGRFEVSVDQGATLGFAFPAHRWSTPPLVDEFVQRLKFVTPDGEPYAPAYCFTVETYGHFPGTESKFFAKLLWKYQGLKVDAAFAVQSVGNCLYLFNTPSDDIVMRKLDVAGKTANGWQSLWQLAMLAITWLPIRLARRFRSVRGMRARSALSRYTTCSPTSASVAAPALRFVRPTRFAWSTACPCGKAIIAQNA